MSPKESVAMYVLYIYAYAFHMRQRKVLRDNEWAGWIGLIRASAFRKGTIDEYLENNRARELVRP